MCQHSKIFHDRASDFLKSPIKRRIGNPDDNYEYHKPFVAEWSKEKNLLSLEASSYTSLQLARMTLLFNFPFKYRLGNRIGADC